MSTIFGLDIPSGLETLFQKIFGIPSVVAPAILKVSNTAVPRSRRAALLTNTFLGYLASIYDPLSTARHTAWTNYWIGLPYGSHAGANGYPGSGFSGFVHINALRYKNGLSLILDAPPANLVQNGGFTSGLTHWHTNGAVSVTSGRCRCDSDDSQIYQTQPPNYILGKTYRVYFEYQNAAVYDEDTNSYHYFSPRFRIFSVSTIERTFSLTSTDRRLHKIQFDFVANAAFIASYGGILFDVSTSGGIGSYFIDNIGIHQLN